MDVPTNSSDGLKPVFGEMNRISRDLSVIGKLQVGEKLRVVQDATGPKLDISKKGPLQGISRTVQNISGKALAKVSDTVSYIHKLNDRTLDSIVTLFQTPNLNKEQLEISLKTLRDLNAQTSSALTGMDKLRTTYKNSEVFETEKTRLELTLQEGNKVYDELNRQLQQRIINEQEIRPLMVVVEALPHPSSQEEHLQLSEEDAEKIEKTRNILHEMLYETSKVGDSTTIQSVKAGESRAQFRNDLGRWRSLQLDGEELYSPGKRDVDKLSAKIYAAYGSPPSDETSQDKGKHITLAHLITQTNVFDTWSFLVDAYKDSQHPHTSSADQVNILLYSHKGEVHLEFILHYTIDIQKEGNDPEYAFSRIAKREIIIPQNGKDFDFSKMRVKDSYSKEISTKELARDVMKVA